MALKTAADIVGLELKAVRRLPKLRTPEDNAEVLGFVEPSQTVGVIRSWVDWRREGNEFWYWEFDDSARGGLSTFYVPHDPGRLNMGQLQEDYHIRQTAKRKAQLEWWERLAQNAGQAVSSTASSIFNGVLIIGGAYVLAKLFSR